MRPSPGQHPLLLTASLAAGTLVAAATGLLLHRLLYGGFAQTFDTMLYARALWGVAHGDFYNPTAGVHAFSVHAHWGLLALAPVVRLLDAALVLVWAQAVSAGATAALVGVAAGREAAASGIGRASVVVGCATAVAGVVASPLVGNPFLFDARPDLLAVPLATAALLRIRHRGDVDVAAAALLLAAVAMREEVAMLAAPAFLLAPARTGTTRWGLRVGGAAISLGYWAVYWLVLRKLFGGAEAVDRLDGTASLFLGGALGDWLAGAAATGRWKLEIAAAAAATMGGAALLGHWRWWLVAGPGLAFVILPNRMPELALNFHYGLFAAPALLVAGVDGIARGLAWANTGPAQRHRRRRVALALSATLVATTIFAASSAFPGGGRFRPQWLAPEAEAASDIAAAHAVLAALPADASLTVSYVWGAPYCDRSLVESDVMLRTRLLRDGSAAEAMDYVALRPHEAARSRVQLVEELGYTEQIVADGALVLFRRAGVP